MLLKNIAYLNEKFDVLFHYDIRIEKNIIVEINKNIAPQQSEEIIDGKNLLVLPGLCDAHTHIGQQLLKGKVLDAEGIIWKDIMLPFESSLTPEIMALNTKLALIEMIRGGTTSFVDAGSYHMDAACEEIIKSGMRAAVTYSTMDDPNLPESIRDNVQSAVEKNDSLYEKWNGKGLLKVYYSLRSLMSVSEEMILEVSKHARERETMIQAHMNEYGKEVDYVVEKTGLPPYEYLDSLNVLDDSFIGVHSLILTEKEKEIIEKNRIQICQCPFSNSGKALSNAPELLKRGITLGLGSDGAAHGGLSLWDEMKTLRCMMNVTWGIEQQDRKIMPAKSLLKMAVESSRYFLRENIGVVKEGYKADLIFIDLNQPHLWYSHNYTNALLECVNKGDIIHSMIDGRWLMRDRKLLTIDEAAVHEELNRYFNK